MKVLAERDFTVIPVNFLISGGKKKKKSQGELLAKTAQIPPFPRQPYSKQEESKKALDF